MTKDLCPNCENYDICILRRNGESSVTHCCMFCKSCKSYNWSYKDGPNIFNCDLLGSFSALERHSCGRFKHE